MEQKFHRTFVPGSEKAGERKRQGAKVPGRPGSKKVSTHTAGCEHNTDNGLFTWLTSLFGLILG